LQGPDPALLEKLYVPMLSEAIRYDRCCAYFSSSVLSATARGFGQLIERLQAMGERAPRPAVRLVVNEELSRDDVRAMTERGDLSRLERQLERRFKTPKDLLEKQRLKMLGWLVKHNFLEVRVGVMRHGEGIVHSKFGVATDEVGDAVVFNGSGNESALGLLGNYEQLEVTTSWQDKERHQWFSSEFGKLWTDTHPDVHTVTLPEALRLRLIRFAPKEAPIREPSNALERQKAAMMWQFIVEAPYLPNGGTACDATALVDLWPHQRRVVEEVAEAWPEGRLLCDEVGMGKTIEAMLVIRRLMAGRGVKRVLILLPAGLLKQWQSELREKGGMIFPRLDGLTKLVWPDGREKTVSGLAEALKEDLLLVSRETARTAANAEIVLSAPPWDLVVLDEAHAARRRRQEEGEFNSGTLLLDLVRKLQLHSRARGFLFLSATPMQTHPWEPWDLLAVLGEGGRWLSEFSVVKDFYYAIDAVRRGECDNRTAREVAALIAGDPEFPPLPDDGAGKHHDMCALAERLTYVPASRRQDIARWLRSGSPLVRRMHRNTRETLRRYYEKGLLPHRLPNRHVDDKVFDFNDPAERRVYNSVAQYIESRYRELESEKRGKGFVMTIYRRRTSSSPLALERSLKRRCALLRNVVQERASFEYLEPPDVPERLDDDDLPEEEATLKVPASVPQDPRAVQSELQEAENLLAQHRTLGGRDTKRDLFFEVLKQLTDDGRSVLVFTEYADTLEYLRDSLVEHYGKGLGCFSGAGGQIWDVNGWNWVTKDVITRSLENRQLHVLVCTDAASEGLNLQAAGALINYDLPWNPSKVEQRIGRIDRIGQKCAQIKIVNLFLRNSVDEKVYGALRRRCRLFELFVGKMQPVLAKARRMLMGQEDLDIQALERTADEVEQNPLAVETYLEKELGGTQEPSFLLTRKDIEDALMHLDGSFGPRTKSDKTKAHLELSGGRSDKAVFSSRTAALESDPTVLPLSPFDIQLKEIAETLSRPGENLPLAIGSFERNSFRSSVAYWVVGGREHPIKGFEDLRTRICAWSGEYPDPQIWLRAAQKAKRRAKDMVEAVEKRAMERQRAALTRQIEGARIRLTRELGRYLVCVDPTALDLNELLHGQMARDIRSAGRLQKVLERLGGYPDCSEDMLSELRYFASLVTESQRKGLLIGAEIDAALEDPRWAVAPQRGCGTFTSRIPLPLECGWEDFS